MPALLPPVPVPGHPSFPSGHATQATLMALAVREAMTPQGAAISADNAARASLLDTLAWRIGRNREIAGLHFESDSRAGAALAYEVFGHLKTRLSFDDALTRARAGGEWP
jgi:membrane-associated phospholipid phosphatase